MKKEYTFIIWRHELHVSDDKIVAVVEARDEADALIKVGFRPDAEDSSLAGYHPTNEFGRGWYPHVSAHLTTSEFE
jgi:hypothetical protein